MAVYNYDVVVLGSGPAGEGAAMNAAKAGRTGTVLRDYSAAVHPDPLDQVEAEWAEAGIAFT